MTTPGLRWPASSVTASADTCVHRSHYLFEDRFGRRGTQGQGRGDRRLPPELLVPSQFRNFDLNTHLEACCAKRWAGTTAWPRPDGRRTPGTVRSSAPSRNRLRRLRQARVRVGCAIAAPITLPHTVGHCEVLMSTTLRRRGDCQAPAFIRARGLSSIRCTSVRAKDQRAGSGGSLGRLAVAAGVRRSPPPT